MGHERRLRKRATFDEVADLYAHGRPRYPEVVIDDVVELAGFGPGSRVVEIGCGTGQATAALAERGLEVTCVELGPRLAEIARRELAHYPSVRVVNADFEHWEPEGGLYDGIASFNAFHWVDPERRYGLAARLLRPGGALAVVSMPHVMPPVATRSSSRRRRTIARSAWAATSRTTGARRRLTSPPSSLRAACSGR